MEIEPRNSDPSGLSATQRQQLASIRATFESHRASAGLTQGLGRQSKAA